jgi:hypothetical protein
VDKTEARTIQKHLDELLKPLAALGYTATIRGGTFDGDVLDSRIRIQKIGGDTKEAAEFKRCANLFGLKPEDLGRTFDLRGTTYEIVGLKLSDRKGMSILIKAADGTMRRCREDVVVRLLSPNGPALAKLAEAAAK